MPPPLPIRIDATSNGEFAPDPPGRGIERARELAAQRITANARRTGRSRRTFLAGLCGAATTLLTLNQAFAFRGFTGGRFGVLPEGAFDEDAAAQSIAGNEFIFDAQTHFVEPDAPWRNGPAAGWQRTLAAWPQGSCGENDPVACYSADHFIREVFLDSDTDMAMLSFVPTAPGENPLSMAESERARRLVEQLDGTDRLLLQTPVIPNWRPLAAQLDHMEEMAAAYPIAAWKTYTGWGPGGAGWWLDDAEFGIPFLDKARELGVRTICTHKGLPFSGQDRTYASCEDVGRAARRYPDINFVLYHAGYETAVREGAFAGAGAARGTDTLVRSLQANNVGPNANVYAELGSTWRHLLRDPDQAAHVLGKLLVHVGADNVLWGTDSIWYGSPQDQIQAFRAFQISEQFQERYGYPALTPTLKAGVLGRNAARLFGIDADAARRRAAADPVGTVRHAYRESPAPGFATYGPRTSSEFHRYRRLHGAGPG